MTWMDFTLGWEVILQRKAADRDVPATSREGAGDLVIRWRAHRVAWIEELCTAGGGVDLGGGTGTRPSSACRRATSVTSSMGRRPSTARRGRTRGRRLGPSPRSTSSLRWPPTSTTPNGSS